MEVYSRFTLFLYRFFILTDIKILLENRSTLYYTNTYEAVSSNITGTVTIENGVYHWANDSLDMVIQMDQTDEEEVSFVAQKKRIQTSNYLFIYCMKTMVVMW